MIKPITERMIPPRCPSDDKVTFGKPTVLIIDDNGNYAQINVNKGKSVLICVTSKEHKLDKIV